MSIDELIQILSKPIVFGSIFAILFLLILFYVVRSFKKRRVSKKLNQYEILYNECISVPISFKLNKASSIAKSNTDKEKIYNNLKLEYDDLDKRHDEIATVMEDIEDALAFNKLSMASRSMEDLGMLVEEALRLTRALDTRLDEVLEEEQEKRDEINVLKDTFRNLKTKLMGNVGLYRDAYDVLEAQTKNIESLFSQFEEWMFASDYEKAEGLIDEIHDDLTSYENNLDSVPKLYEMARGKIPVLLDKVSETYQEVLSEDVYLEHLEVPKNIGVLAEVLKDDLKRIAEVDVTFSDESLTNTFTRLEQIQYQIEKEVSANHEMNLIIQQAFPLLDEVLLHVSELLEKAPVVEKRFHFEELVHNVTGFSDKAQALSMNREKLLNEVETKEKPATVLLVSTNEIKHDIEILAKSLYEVMHQVNQANADEIRAKKQLMKLYLIINDVEVKIKKRSLPSISEKYAYDLQKSRAYVRQINDLLDQTILDIPTLNGTVSEAIDYIYKLHNNVNNLVGVVDMCEDSIVYANKYRAYVPDIDSELTKAELAFNNGEYTQSLTMIINAVDRYKPDSRYEEMIKKNAKSAR